MHLQSITRSFAADIPRSQSQLQTSTRPEYCPRHTLLEHQNLPRSSPDCTAGLVYLWQDPQPRSVGRECLLSRPSSSLHANISLISNPSQNRKRAKQIRSRWPAVTHGDDQTALTLHACHSEKDPRCAAHHARNRTFFRSNQGLDFGYLRMQQAELHAVC